MTKSFDLRQHTIYISNEYDDTIYISNEYDECF